MTGIKLRDQPHATEHSDLPNPMTTTSRIGALLLRTNLYGSIVLNPSATSNGATSAETMAFTCLGLIKGLKATLMQSSELGFTRLPRSPAPLPPPGRHV